MKTIIASSLLALTFTTAAFAGNVVEPRIEPEVIAADTAASGGDLFVPIFALIMFTAGAVSN